MANQQLKDFAESQLSLARTIDSTAGLADTLDANGCADRLRELREKVSSDSFRIMVVGDFKTGKSTLINALLGAEVLPAWAVPTTAIINEISYGEEPSARLHFLNPQPPEVYDTIPERALEHIRAHEGLHIPPIDLPVDEIEDYVVIPEDVDPRDLTKQSPFSHIELHWPLELLRDGVQIVDSPGLRENPVRTQVTMSYLSSADAVVFVVNALQAGSKDELEFLDRVLPMYGIAKESLFCVANRYNQIRNDRERDRVRNHVDRLMNPYARKVFYVAALPALDARIDGDEAACESTQVPAFERELTRYLARDRGRVKLASPARETVRSVRQDLLEGVIPQRRRALSLSLEELKSNYAQVQPEFDRLRQRRDLLVTRAGALVEGMGPELRHFALGYFRTLPDKVSEWVEAYEPETTVSMLHLKHDSEALATELNDYVQNQLSLDMREWTNGPFAERVQQCAVELEGELEDYLEDFYLALDKVELQVTGAPDAEVKGAPAWQRAVACAGGFLLCGVSGAVAGAGEGLTVEFARNVGITFAAQIAMALLGLWNPVTFVAIVAANLLATCMGNTSRAVKNAKKTTIENYTDTLKEQAPILAEKAATSALESLGQIRELVGSALSNEIDEMDAQIKSVMGELEAGEENVAARLAELDECEQALRSTADELDTLIFELAKQS